MWLWIVCGANTSMMILFWPMLGKSPKSEIKNVIVNGDSLVSVNSVSILKQVLLNVIDGWHHTIFGWLSSDVAAHNSEYILLDRGEHTRVSTS